MTIFMSAVGKVKISHEAEHAVFIFWKYFVFIGETMIFTIAGTEVGALILEVKILCLKKLHFTF
jgi:hypothetical protein